MRTVPTTYVCWHAAECVSWFISHAVIDWPSILAEPRNFLLVSKCAPWFFRQSLIDWHVGWTQIYFFPMHWNICLMIHCTYLLTGTLAESKVSLQHKILFYDLSGKLSVSCWHLYINSACVRTGEKNTTLAYRYLGQWWMIWSHFLARENSFFLNVESVTVPFKRLKKTLPWRDHVAKFKGMALLLHIECC